MQSRTSRNLLADFLAERGLSVDGLSRASGAEPAEARALLAEPRRLPTHGFLERVGLALGADPASLVAFDPVEPRALGTAAEPFGVAVVGAGNLGHALTAVLGARTDVRVNLLVSTAERADALRTAMDADGGVEVSGALGPTRGAAALVTADPAAAVRGARAVLLCLPAHVEAAALARIAPHLAPGAVVGSLPAPGGFDWKARRILAGAEDVTVFGLGAVPWMCKVEQPGRRVRVLGSKLVNGLALAGPGSVAEVCDLLSNLLDQPVLDFGSFLQITLNPGNQLLHPGLMYSRFRDWDGTPLPEPPVLYEGTSEADAALLRAMSDEVMALRAALEAGTPGLRLSAVLPLELSIRVAYGPAVEDPSTLRSTIATNRAYAGLRVPMRPAEGGWVPDPTSRFFEEDVPHGLVVLRGLADLAGVPVPTIDRVLRWAQARMGREYLVGDELTGRDLAESGAPQVWGVRTLAELG